MSFMPSLISLLFCIIFLDDYISKDGSFEKDIPGL